MSEFDLERSRRGNFYFVCVALVLLLAIVVCGIGARLLF
jgi:hypothetical protein